jgi:hypothetical protein
MRHILLVIPNAVFAAVIAVGLGFAAAQAGAGTPDLAELRVPCDSPPGTCPDPIYDCDLWCEQQSYPYGGECMQPLGCCLCFQR